jgi:uncharacterized protein (DUF952 family)
LTLIYKILLPEAWDAAVVAGVLTPAGVDARDGYVHLSAAAQVAETLRLWFAEPESVVLAAFEAEALGDVRWEPSRDGALFPHLYGPLRAGDAVQSWRLTRGADGRFLLPALA